MGFADYRLRVAMGALGLLALAAACSGGGGAPGPTPTGTPGLPGLYVANYGANTITQYSLTATGDAAPTRTLSGGAADIGSPIGLAVDASGNLAVSQSATNAIAVYAAPAGGNEAPLRTLSGANTGLDQPSGIAYDSSGNLAVANNANSSVTVYASGASGNLAAARTISGATTTLHGPARRRVRCDRRSLRQQSKRQHDSRFRPGSDRGTSRRSERSPAPRPDSPAPTASPSMGAAISTSRTNRRASPCTQRAPRANTAPSRTIAGASTGLSTADRRHGRCVR